MKSLRARLFLSVGAIFLIVAILSYWLPKIVVRNDINHAASHLNCLVNSYQQNIRDLSKSWVTYRFWHVAAQLHAIVQAIEVSEKNIWDIATAVLRYDPEMALVQVTNQENQTAVICVEGAQFLTPSWAYDGDGQLWIKLQDGDIVKAQLLNSQKKNIFLLFPKNDLHKRSLVFTHFDSASLSNKPSSARYEDLQRKEELLLKKIALIEKLVPWHQDAVGILEVDAHFKTGAVLLSNQIFSNHALIKKNITQDPFVIYREEGPYVDLVQWVSSVNRSNVLVGLSLSTICSEMARMLQRPILLYNRGELVQAFTTDGSDLPLKNISLGQGNVTWNGIVFTPFSVKIKESSIDILTPASEVNSISHFLTKLNNALISKISLNLLMVAIIVFGMALLLLARTSKKITEPIVLLAQASEEIGKGKYENLALPIAENRHDEVAILTHSFHKMVLSLQDREKIRGVLNKVVSKEIATQILNSDIELGGEKRVLTMLFSDIRGFTPLSEILTPQKLIDLLNSYMTRMCRIVDETHGVVDKFVGDEIMALYGAPLDLDDHAGKAIKAALLMMDDLKQWNVLRGSQEPQIEVGIGIHTGVAFSGNMGAENRLNYTVVGANVNLAARLCSAAKPGQILISEQTYHALGNPSRFNIKPLAPINLKGIDQPVDIYSVT